MMKESIALVLGFLGAATGEQTADRFRWCSCSPSKVAWIAWISGVTAYVEERSSCTENWGLQRWDEAA